MTGQKPKQETGPASDVEDPIRRLRLRNDEVGRTTGYLVVKLSEPSSFIAGRTLVKGGNITTLSHVRSLTSSRAEAGGKVRPTTAP